MNAQQLKTWESEIEYLQEKNRQQQAQIEALKVRLNPYQSITDTKIEPTVVSYTHPVELTDEEINKLWAESHEDGIAMQQGFTTQQHYFAHLLLRKAQEK
jgi:hypothetical protein